MEKELEAVRMMARTELQQQLVDTGHEIGRLKGDNEALERRLRGQQMAQAELYHYLHGKLEDNYRVIERLEAQASHNRAERARRTAEASSRMERSRLDHEAKVAALVDQQKTLEQDVATLNDFWKHRDDLQREKDELERLLEAARVHNLEAAQQMLDKNSSTRDELQAVMRRQIQDTRTHMVAQTESLLEDKTKRKIMQNEIIKNELLFQSREGKKLLARFECVNKENQELRSQIRDAKAHEQEAAAKLHAARREHDAFAAQLKTMREARRARWQATQGGISASSSSLGVPLAGPVTTTTVATGAVSALSERGTLDRLIARLQADDEKHQSLKTTVAEADAQVQEMVALQDDLVSVLLEAVQDCSNPEHDLWSHSQLDDGASLASTIMSSRTGHVPPSFASAATAPSVRLELIGPAQRPPVLGLILARLHNRQLELRAKSGTTAQSRRRPNAPPSDNLPLDDGSLSFALPPLR